MNASRRAFLCNGAELPSQTEGPLVRHLDWQPRDGREPNVRLSLDRFVTDVLHLPDRVLDLLEIAAYVYCADRSADRGEADAVEYHGWSRHLELAMRVRDHSFWIRNDVQTALSEAVVFMSGHRSFEFNFQPGHSTPAANLFDRPDCAMQPTQTTAVLLFSGGLDSLAGAVERLQGTDDHLCLVSHQSQPGSTGVQNRLVALLRERYPSRIAHCRFACGLRGASAAEESQRTRAFLYSSIGFAICRAYRQSCLYVYENGLTAVNIEERQDSINARNSRTAHPRTLALLERIYALVADEPVRIERPFQWSTKTDIMNLVSRHGAHDLVDMTVSCSQTRSVPRLQTHCGLCSQCIERRFAAYSSEMENADSQALYAYNFITDAVTDGTAKAALMEFVRQALLQFAVWGRDQFYYARLNELAEITPYVGLDEEAAVEHVYQLCQRHGRQVKRALQRMRELHDDLQHRLPEGCLLRLVNEQEHFKEPVERLARDICAQFREPIALMYQRALPPNERDLNDKIQALLRTREERWEREYPSVRFGMASAVPDHSCPDRDLLIETKYVRAGESPSKATAGLAEDLTKYPRDCHLLFIVYAAEGTLTDEARFREAVEVPGRSTLLIIHR